MCATPSFLSKFQRISLNLLYVSLVCYICSMKDTRKRFILLLKEQGISGVAIGWLVGFLETCFLVLVAPSQARMWAVAEQGQAGRAVLGH
jgi:hypothetical protein